MLRRISKLTVLSPWLLAACIVRQVPTPYTSQVATPPHEKSQNGSIFDASRYTPLAADNRARHVGDIVSIRLIERTQAAKSASATSGRTSDFTATLPDVKPFSYVPDGLLSGGSKQSFKGQGTAAQSNQLTGDIAVTIEEVLPGGTLRISGQKQVSLNRGMEFIRISGLIRPQDIGPDNKVDSPRVANARITYSGSGEIAQQSRIGWLQQFFTTISPF